MILLIFSLAFKKTQAHLFQCVVKQDHSSFIQSRSLKSVNVTLEVSTLHADSSQPVMPSSQLMSIPPPPRRKLSQVSVIIVYTGLPQRATLKTIPLKDGAMSATYSPWLHTAKLSVLPFCSSVVVTCSAFWKCVTLKGLFVLMVHLHHHHQ